MAHLTPLGLPIYRLCLSPQPYAVLRQRSILNVPISKPGGVRCAMRYNTIFIASQGPATRADDYTYFKAYLSCMLLLLSVRRIMLCLHLLWETSTSNGFTIDIWLAIWCLASYFMPISFTGISDSYVAIVVDVSLLHVQNCYNYFCRFIFIYPCGHLFLPAVVTLW